MKISAYILISLLLLSACRKAPEFSLQFEKSIALAEPEEHPISLLPEYMQMINDTLISFNNDVKSIDIYNVKTGILVSQIIPILNSDSLLKQYNTGRKGKIEKYDISKHPDAFVRQYPKYRVEAYTYSRDTFMIYYYLLNPIKYNDVFHLELIPYMLKTDFQGNVFSINIIEKDIFPNPGVELSPFYGFLYHETGDAFYAFSWLMNRRQNSRVAASLIEKKGNMYTIKKAFTLPFPNELYFKKLDTLSDSYQIYYPLLEPFVSHNGRILCANGRDIYDLESGKLLCATPATEGDSMSRIRAFFPVRHPVSGKDYFVVQQEVIDSPMKFIYSLKYLAVKEPSEAKATVRVFMGDKVSGMTHRGNRIYFLRQEKDEIRLVSYLLKFSENL